jgi:hypothetical protein
MTNAATPLSLFLLTTHLMANDPMIPRWLEFQPRHTFQEQAALNSAARAVAAPERKGFEIRLEPTAIWAAPENTMRQSVTRVFPAGQPLRLRINCGAFFVEPGWEYTDKSGNVWFADRAHQEGAQWGALGGGTVARPSPTPRPGQAPSPEADVYLFERYGMSGYRFQLPPGTYTVRLHFAENHQPGAGNRVFDVTVNGKPVLTEFDVFKETGGLGAPLVRDFKGLETRDGRMEIGFTPRQGEPMINGIQILGETPLRDDFTFETGFCRLDAASPPALSDPGKALYRVDVGTMLSDGWRLHLGDAVWQPDCGRDEPRGYGFIGGATTVRGSYLDFRGTLNPGPYRSERFGLKGYEFDVPNGTYTVRLHFADGFESIYRPGCRVFDVAVQGRTVLEKCDPFVAGGGLAHASAFEVSGVRVENGVLHLGFSSENTSTLLNGLEVFEGRAEDQSGMRQVLGPVTRTALRPSSDAKLCRVLHIGNSHNFFWAIPETVAMRINTAQRQVWIEPYRYLHGGWHLQAFLDPLRDTVLGCLKTIAAGQYDFVVVQDSINGYTPKKLDAARWQEAMENNHRLAEAIRASGARMIMYLMDNPKNWPPEEESRAALLKLVHDDDILLIPAREAWDAVAAASPPAAFIPHNDGVHASVHQAYLTTCLFWIAWTGQSPEGNPAPYLVGQELRIDAPIARWIETFAWRFYTDYANKYGLKSGILQGI